MPFSPIDANGGLSLERLYQALHYDPETGFFTWLIPGDAKGGGGRRGIGRRAGRVSKAGYVRLSLDSVRYRAHRLAWLYMTGEWPSDQVDHRNGVRHDNRWSNLRIATQPQNSANMLRHGSALGVKGVQRYENSVTGTVRFRAHITVGGKFHYLGSFLSLEAAASAYEAAAIQYFGEFARAA